MKVLSVLAALALVAFSSLVSAQSPAVDGEAMSARLAAAQGRGQADAVRDGDEALTCDAIQTEMAATMNDPAVQEQMAGIGAWAENQQDRMEGAQGAMATGPGLIAGIVGSFIPGVGFAQSLAMQAQVQSQRPAAEQSQRETVAMAGDMEAVMPQLMRGQRLYELAEARECPFLQAPPQH